MAGWCRFNTLERKMVKEGKRGERREKGNERREKHVHRSGTNPFLCSFTYAQN